MSAAGVGRSCLQRGLGEPLGHGARRVLPDELLGVDDGEGLDLRQAAARLMGVTAQLGGPRFEGAGHAAGIVISPPSLKRFGVVVGAASVLSDISKEGSGQDRDHCHADSCDKPREAAVNAREEA